jgi:hypothetical protein
LKGRLSQARENLSYCGVNVHFQNGRVEKKIRDLQDSAHTSLLHAIRKWPKVITTNLWPYALRYANDIHNVVPNKGEDLSPIEKFTRLSTVIPLKRCHHFGCYENVLKTDLQSGKRARGSKWKNRARLGVNLGFSPQHVKSVHLILSLTTGVYLPNSTASLAINFPQ